MASKSVPNFAFSRRPLLVVAGIFILGIWVHDVLPVSPWVYLLMAALATVAAGLILARPGGSTAFLCLAVFLAAIGSSQTAAFRYPADHISQFAGDSPRLAQVEFRIDHPPRILTTPFGQFRSLPPKQVTTATILQVKTRTGWEPASGQVLIQIAEPHPRLAVNQTVRALGMLDRPGPAMNPGQFDWADYYREQRILNSLNIPHAENLTLLSSPKPSLVQGFRENVRQLLAAGFSQFRALDHALLRALLLGDNDPQLRDVQDQFIRTGTSHHLAISGMHVAVLGGFLYLLCRLLRLSPRLATLICTGFVVFYGTVALPSPPVIRSVLLCVVFAIGILFRRALDPIQLLSLSVLAMLAYHPLDLYSAGFQLSFGVVLGLMLFTRPAVSWLMSLRRTEPEFVQHLQMQQLTTLGRMSYRAGALLRDAVVAGVVAWLVSMPLVAYHFERLNPWAIPASLLLAIPVFLALIGGLFKVVLTLCFPSLAAAWAELAGFPVQLMRYSVDVLAMLPRSDVPFPAPPIPFIVAFYLLLALPLLPIDYPRIRRCIRFSPGAAVGVAFVPVLLGIGRTGDSSGNFSATVLAVGAGSCTVINLPDGRTILLDAGSTSLSDPVRKCIGPFLRHAGVRTVDSLYISHANYDHFSAAAELAEAYDLSNIYLPQRFREHSINNPPAEMMLDRFDKLSIRPTYLNAPGMMQLTPETTLQVLWPLAETELPANESSLVIKLTCRGRSILFTGDIQQQAMAALLKNPADLRSDVLIAPHHGSSEAVTPAFLKAVDPKYILSSNDRTLSRKQIDFERMTRNIPLYRTHTHGAQTVRIDLSGYLTVQPHLKAD